MNEPPKVTRYCPECKAKVTAAANSTCSGSLVELKRHFGASVTLVRPVAWRLRQ